MGVVSRRWMWVESMGVVVRRYCISGISGIECVCQKNARLLVFTACA